MHTALLMCVCVVAAVWCQAPRLPGPRHRAPYSGGAKGRRLA